MYCSKRTVYTQDSQLTWKSGKSVNYQGIWKWILFTEKSGNFD